MFTRNRLSELKQIMVVTKIDNMASYSTYTGKPKILFPKKVRIKNLRSHRRHTFYNNMYAIGILIAAFKTRKNYINKESAKRLSL